MCEIHYVNVPTTNYFLQFRNTRNVYSLLQLEFQVSRLYHTTGKAIVLYAAVITVSGRRVEYLRQRLVFPESDLSACPLDQDITQQQPLLCAVSLMSLQSSQKEEKFFIT
jgi:hypothetical protein